MADGPNEPSWSKDPMPSFGGSSKKIAGTEKVMDEVADRTAQISSRLKAIYKKSVEPVEKRFRYDYFFESPFLTDVEFDGKVAFPLPFVGSGDFPHTNAIYFSDTNAITIINSQAYGTPCGTIQCRKNVIHSIRVGP